MNDWTRSRILTTGTSVKIVFLQNSGMKYTHTHRVRFSHTHKHAHTPTHTHTNSQKTQTHKHTNTNTHSYTHTHTHTHTHSHTHKHKHTHRRSLYTHSVSCIDNAMTTLSDSIFITQMAGIAGASILKNRERFRRFFRTLPSFEFVGPSLAEIARKFEWTQMAIITQKESLFTLVNVTLYSVWCYVNHLPCFTYTHR